MKKTLTRLVLFFVTVVLSTMTAFQFVYALWDNPRIDTFIVNGAYNGNHFTGIYYVYLGQTCTLSWHTSNAETVTIDQGIGIVNPSGNLQISPAVDTVYTITATNSGETVSESVEINVISPVVEYFIAEPYNNSWRLSWETSYAQSVYIDNDIGHVNDDGYLLVSPTETTTYTLTATAPVGGVEPVTETVTIYLPPRILSFNAYPPVIPIGGTSTITWDIENASTVSIDQGIGAVDASGSIEVAPNENTTYTVTASCQDNVYTVTRSTTVSFFTPIIHYFNCDINHYHFHGDLIYGDLIYGEEIKLRWATSNSDLVSIDHGIGDVDSQGELEVIPLDVTPAGTTTYTLTASGPGGVNVADLTIQFERDSIPRIKYFSASPRVISSGEVSTLNWRTQNVTTVSIDQGIGVVDENGLLEVSPTETATYTLTAEDDYGGVLTETVMVEVLPRGIRYGYDALGRIKKINRAFEDDE